MSEPTWPPASASVVNPYAPPKASITPAALDGDQEYAEQIRRELIKHETSIKSVGFLYLFGATFMVIFAISLIAISLLGTGEPSVGLGLGIVAFYGVLAALSIYLGIGLRKLSPKIRTGVTILSVIGLLGFPLGTLINAYILYLLHSVALLRLPRANPELYAQVQVRIPKAWQQAAGLTSVASMAGIIGVQMAQDLAVLRATSLAERVAAGSLTSLELAVAWSFAGWGIYALGRRRLRPGVA